MNPDFAKRKAEIRRVDVRSSVPKFSGAGLQAAESLRTVLNELPAESIGKFAVPLVDRLAKVGTTPPSLSLGPLA